MAATLDRITIYPIKSLPGHEVTEAAVLSAGALENDRRFALVDAAGEYVNGKRVAAIQRVQAIYTGPLQDVLLTWSDQQANFSLVHDQEAIGVWFSRVLGITCRFVENRDGGFPDDTDAPGPTLVTTASLKTVAGWYEGITLAEARLRFRANLEVGGTVPFWEDRLVVGDGSEGHFSIGESAWQGKTISQRCVVPTRDPATGKTIAHFARTFAAQRGQQLPAWAPRNAFDHFYRLAINTRWVTQRLAMERDPPVLRVGDRIEVRSESGKRKAESGERKI